MKVNYTEELMRIKNADIELYWDVLDILNVPLDITNDFDKIAGFLATLNEKQILESIQMCEDLQKQFASIGYTGRFINHSPRD